MALTSGQLATVKRRANESDNGMVSDEDIQLIADESGLIVDGSGYAPDHASYTTRYDLNAIAAEVWREKAGMVSGGFDFTAEGASFTRSQMYEQFMKMATYRASMISNLSV